MTLTQILQKIRSVFYTKSEIDSMGGGTNLSTTISNKANDSSVVHKTGNETIGGFKNFTQRICMQNTDIDLLTTPASNKYSLYTFKDKNNKDLSYVQYAQRSIDVNDLDLYVFDKNSVAQGIQINTNHEVNPIGDDYSLGARITQGCKWKYINGINPGALSLPRRTDHIEISIPQGISNYTPLLDGWLQVTATGLNFQLSNGLGMTSRFHFFPLDVPYRDFGGYVPCRKGIVCYIYVDTPTTGYFIPCQGNVGED